MSGSGFKLFKAERHFLKNLFFFKNCVTECEAQGKGLFWFNVSIKCDFCVFSQLRKTKLHLASCFTEHMNYSGLDSHRGSPVLSTYKNQTMLCRLWCAISLIHDTGILWLLLSVLVIEEK